MPWVIALVLHNDVTEAEALEMAHSISREYPNKECYEVGRVPKGHYVLPPKGKRYCFHEPPKDTSKRTWAPEGSGLPRNYSHHPGLKDGPYREGHIVCRLVDGTQPNSARCIWQAVGRDSQHALELAWQHHEGESLDHPLDVWDACNQLEFENIGYNLGYPYPISPQW